MTGAAITCLHVRELEAEGGETRIRQPLAQVVTKGIIYVGASPRRIHEHTLGSHAIRWCMDGCHSQAIFIFYQEALVTHGLPAIIGILEDAMAIPGNPLGLRL